MFILLAKPIILIGVCLVLLAVFAVLIKIYFSLKSKAKSREYTSEIAKSHSKILKLEVLNDKLQHQINNLEASLKYSKSA